MVVLLHAAVLTGGAAEAQGLVVTTVGDVVNNSDNQTSLREAIAYAGQLGGAQTVSFSNSTAGGATNFYSGVGQTIMLENGELPIASSLTIAGPGANKLTVSANGEGRVFHVSAGAFDVAFDGLTIANAGVGTDSVGGGIGSETTNSVKVTNCTFDHNHADYGGGIGSSAGTLTVANCTFLSNTAGIEGGGICTVTTGRAKVYNSTFYDNRGYFGGAIGNGGSSNVDVANCTISGNIAFDSNGGIDAFPENGGTVTVGNSIIAGNTSDGQSDVGGTFTSRGHNLIGDASAATGFTNGVNGDQVGADPMLGPLQDNGGPTLTMVPGLGSPAVDAGDNTKIPTDPGTNQPFATDQRGTGFARALKINPMTASPVVDIGACESHLAAATFAPGVAANGLAVDANDEPLDLTSATIGATPPGGTFTGAGVIDNVLYIERLGVGTYTLTYTGPGAITDVIAIGIFTITISATAPYVRVIATSKKGGLGIDVPGEPAGTKFTKLGPPSIDGGQLGALVKIKSVNGVEKPAIFLGAGIVVRKGGLVSAEGTFVGTFASFGEPVFGGGSVAFTAKIAKFPGAPKASLDGLYTILNGYPILVAGPGVDVRDDFGSNVSGLTYNQIQSYALSADGKALTFVATLKGKGVNAANKTGVWQMGELGTYLLFRTGDHCDLSSASYGSGPDVVQKLALFLPAKTISGQRRSYAGSNQVVEALATFSRGRQALLVHSVDSNFNASRTIAFQNDGGGKIGLPSVNASGEFALRAGLPIMAGGASAKDDQVIQVASSPADSSIIAREGSPVSATVTDTYTTLEEPAHNDASATAFLARVKSAGLPTTQTGVVIYNRFVPGVVDPESIVLARTGQPAADLHDGELWKSFTALALPDSDYGPVFLAKLTGPKVNATNNSGLWTTDLQGTVRLAARTSGKLSINGEDKTISLITTLGAVKGSPGQGRYVSLDGNTSALLTFTDRSTALVFFGLPTAP